MATIQSLLLKLIGEGGLPWLRIGGKPSEGEIPWFWHLRDRASAVDWALSGRPFIAGPNLFFVDSGKPRIDALERSLLDTPHCRLIFCHTSAYAQLIRTQRGVQNGAKIVEWPYPVNPFPKGPLPAKWDLLLYVKDGVLPREYPANEASKIALSLESSIPQTVKLVYGNHTQKRLMHLAARSRASVYLSREESGGIATVEMMTAGCPVVATKRGGPLILDGETGYWVDDWDLEEIQSKVSHAHRLNRQVVALVARSHFHPTKILAILLSSLDRARKSST